MKPLIVANWKMNPQNLAQAKQIFNSVKKGLEDVKSAEVVICPPFIYLPTLFDFLSRWIKSQIKLGAQNCFWEEKGAYTGEISLLMLKNFACKYVIIGHSERRGILKETNSMINKKIKAALSFGIKPILCVGEKKEEKQKEKIFVVLKSQVEQGLRKISKKEIENIIFAYEPVWAIGSGNPCSLDESHVVRLLLQKIIAQKYSRQVAQKLQILYGGSVKSSNVNGFIKDAGFQGVLVGGASLDPKEFIEIVKNAS